MKSAFDANVPKRKPRTRLGTMLAEIDAPVVAEDSELPKPAPKAKKSKRPAKAKAKSAARAKVTPPTPLPEPEPVVEPERPLEAAMEAVLKVPQPTAPAARPVADEVNVGRETVKMGRARIDELRSRLEASKRARKTSGPEPARTATMVRETVSGLRDRLETSREERAELLQSLESARSELQTARARITEESEARAAAETLAQERDLIARDLLLESEAMAEERDHALACISELKELDGQQTSLLSSMEETIHERDLAIAKYEAETSELRAGLDAALADLDALNAQCEQLNAEKAVLEKQTTDLREELQRMTSAREALGEIQRLVEGLPASRA